MVLDKYRAISYALGCDPQLKEADLSKFTIDIKQYILDHLPFLEESGLEILSQAASEIEIEEEQRIRVKVEDKQLLERQWENGIHDIYDPTGTVRVRIKNGKPRIGIKIPLPERNTFRTKCCIRIEIKPLTQEQEDWMNALFLSLQSQDGYQVKDKFALKIDLTNGEKVWLNSGGDGYWIETDEKDEEIETLLPVGLLYLGHAKTGILVPELSGKDREFVEQYKHNTSVTSRTAQGTYDTTVSVQKESVDLTADKLQLQVDQNTNEICNHIIEERYAPILSVEKLKSVLMGIASKVNSGIQEQKLRTWVVKYGKKIPPGEMLEKALEDFYQEFWIKLRSAEKGHLDPYELASWIEWEVDAGMHPFVDGCGRIAKAWSAFALARLDISLPRHKSREEYYEAMNKGYEDFHTYYECLALQQQRARQ